MENLFHNTVIILSETETAQNYTNLFNECFVYGQKFYNV